MEWFHYLILWKGRECVGVESFGNNRNACSAAAERINAALLQGLNPEITAQTLSCYPENNHEFYVGYELDDQYRDEFDWSSDRARGDSE